MGGHNPGGRTAIVGLSQSSVGRMRRYLASCEAEYRNMVTLTYPHGYPSDGRLVKEHLRRFLQESRRFRERYRDDRESVPVKWSAFWFLEFQARGAPHFHIFTTGFLPASWVAATWYRIVNSEDLRHLRAGTRVEGLRAGRSGSIAYAMKYAAKSEQKTVPDGYENVGRFWGVSGLRAVVAATILVKPDRMGPRAGDSMQKVKQEVIELRKEGRAVAMVWNDAVQGFYLRDIEAQKKLCAMLCMLASKCAIDGAVGGYGSGVLIQPFEAEDDDIAK